jgi:hypothetical protein
VFAYGATVITIMLGMNDAGYRPYDANLFNTFASGYRHILDRIVEAAPQARVTPLEWTQTDRALPMPLETNEQTVGLALRHSDFMDALNRETLQGSECLQIDGEALGTFDALELATGINLWAGRRRCRRRRGWFSNLTDRRNHLRFAGSG